MNDIERARHVRDHMGYPRRHIYWDLTHLCYRVMTDDSVSFRKYGHDNYRLIE